MGDPWPPQFAYCLFYRTNDQLTSLPRHYHLHANPACISARRFRQRNTVASAFHLTNHCQTQRIFTAAFLVALRQLTAVLLLNQPAARA